jgi:SnoaL-like domain
MDNDATAYLAIQRLQRAYADVATRNAWNEAALLATPDARFTFDTHSGQVFEIEGGDEFVAFGARMNQRFKFYEYIPLNFVVTIGSDGTAHGRSYSLEVAEDGETGNWNEFFGVYEDEYVVFEGTWRFARRHYRTYARRTNGQLQSFPLETTPPLGP